MCYYCGTALPQGKIYRTTLCPDCDRECKTCHNCRFFAPGLQHDCRESIAEAVHDKDAANFCDMFEPERDLKSTGARKAQADSAKDRFKNLFGD